MNNLNYSRNLAVLKRAGSRLGMSLLPVLMAGLGLIGAGRMSAQTFTTLYSFTALNNNTNSDGGSPEAELVLSGNTLYGSALRGGSSGYGTVFAVHTDGSGFTNLHSFTDGNDGASPQAGFVLSGNTLYGPASGGGSSSNGTVFAVNIDGTSFTNLHDFTAGSGSFPQITNSDGANPNGLVLSGNTLYGTAYAGGTSSHGTVFAINTDGSGYTNIHSFAAGEGASPRGGLILTGNTLYGTTYYGGSSGYGTVFAVNTNGTGFTNLHNFTGFSDGVFPSSGLVLSANTLYGTATSAGSGGAGTVFAINTDGTGYTNLHSFVEFPGNEGGDTPSSRLILSGNTLYGTTQYGGSSSYYGTVFAIHTDGTGFLTLYSFTGGRDGANPSAGLFLSGNTLYGTAANGGSSGNGTVFSISFRPQLTITPSGTNVTLSWPISFAGFSYAGYHLQETADLASQGGWTSVADTNLPVIINGHIDVTRPILGPQWSYRLAP